MTDRIEAALPAAQEAILLGDAELTRMLGVTVETGAKIFTQLPHKQPLPYVWQGPPQVLDDSDECVDGWEIFTEHHVWAKPPTLEAVTALNIAGRVRELLKTELAIDGFRVVDWSFESTDAFKDPDGSTHAIVRHRYLVEPSA